MGGVAKFAFPVAVVLDQDRQGAICLVDAFDFRGDDGSGFVPGNSDELALATVMLVAVSLRFPVRAFQGILDSIRRVDPLLVGQAGWALPREYYPGLRPMLW